MEKDRGIVIIGSDEQIGKITKEKGNVMFSIEILSKVLVGASQSETTGDLIVWNNLPSVLIITEGMDINNAAQSLDSDWYNRWVYESEILRSQMNYITELIELARTSAFSIRNVYYDFRQFVLLNYNRIDALINNVYTKQEVDDLLDKKVDKATYNAAIIEIRGQIEDLVNKYNQMNKRIRGQINEDSVNTVISILDNDSNNYQIILELIVEIDC